VECNNTQGHKQSVGLLWMRDQPCHRDLYLTTHNTYKRQASMSGRDWNPQSQQASGCRPSPEIARDGDILVI
jgi:hypothetical protein